jgi:hypothetical protein
MYYCSVFNPAENHARKASLGVLSSIFIPLEQFISELQFPCICYTNRQWHPFYWHSFIFHSFTTKCISFRTIWRVFLLKSGRLVRITVSGCQYRVQLW